MLNTLNPSWGLGIGLGVMISSLYTEPLMLILAFLVHWFMREKKINDKISLKRVFFKRNISFQVSIVIHFSFGLFLIIKIFLTYSLRFIPLEEVRACPLHHHILCGSKLYLNSIHNEDGFRSSCWMNQRRGSVTYYMYIMICTNCFSYMYRYMGIHVYMYMKNNTLNT